MAYKGYKGCGPKKLGASPMKQTTAQNNARRDAKGGSTHQHHSDNRFKKKNTSKVINQGKSNEKLRTKIN